MPFDGFNPSAPRGEPASAAIFSGGSGVSTPTVVNCGVGNIALAALSASVGEALNINLAVGNISVGGVAADVQIPTLVECGVGDMLLSGLTVLEESVLLKVTISYFGRTEQIPIYDKGDIARVKATFTSEQTGTEINPGTVVFRLRKPGGTVTSDTAVITESTGTRYVDLTLDSEGRWRFRWEASGAREEGEFIVQATAMD